MVGNWFKTFLKRLTLHHRNFELLIFVRNINTPVLGILQSSTNWIKVGNLLFLRFMLFCIISILISDLETILKTFQNFQTTNYFVSDSQ